MRALGTSVGAARLLLTIVACAAATIVAWKMMLAFSIPEDMANPAFGTARAPYSDALAPWLEGGLSFLLGVPLPSNVYRPTIGLMWASILAISGRVECIPLVFAGALIAFTLAAVFVLTDRGLRGAVVFWIALCASSFATVLGTLNVATTNVDLASLVFTVAGVVLMFWSTNTASPSALLVGCMSLGIAGAIRGPMLVAGPLLILGRCLVARPRPSAALITGCALLFLLPMAIDVTLQKTLGVVNNGLANMYCMYSDPNHSWTPACHASFVEQHVSARDVLQGYLKFITSGAGLHLLGSSMASRVARDLRPLDSARPILLLFGCALLSVEAPRRAATLARSALLSIGIALAGVQTQAQFGGIVFLAAAGALCIPWRLWRALVFLSGYCAAMVFLCLLGLHWGDRLESTFTPLLYFGLLLWAVDESGESATVETRSRGASISAAATALAVVVLYLGGLALPSSLRASYRDRVLGRENAAMKISDDIRIDRSLYFTGSRQLIYTRHDDLRPGEVRIDQGLASNSNGNVSFREPNRFVNIR